MARKTVAHSELEEWLNYSGQMAQTYPDYSIFFKIINSRLHRSIYLEVETYGESKGVIKDCHYYDRQCRRTGLKIAPNGLFSCFFTYSREGLLKLVNNELECDFNHILICTDGSLDVLNNMTPICGAV